MDHTNISSIKSRKPKKRVGHGIGSGKGGHTTGRGAKGQKGREKVRAHFEGGQMPFYKRVPKGRGFKSLEDTLEITVSKLNKFPDGTTLSRESLIRSFGNKSLKYKDVKVIGGSGKLTKKLNFNGVRFTKSARELVIGCLGKIF